MADGIYDHATVYRAIQRHSKDATVDIVVPPRRNAVLSKDASSAPTPRDVHIGAIREHGLFQWRWESGYYAQSKVENEFSRYKTIIGGSLRAKRTESQEREARLGCVILNPLRALGMPQSVTMK